MHEPNPKPDTYTVKRSWVWEIHKNCDALLHQRLAAFTAAQSMALVSFTALTVARFTADPCKISILRILLEVVHDFEERIGTSILIRLLPWQWSTRRASFYETYRSIIAASLPAVELLFWTFLSILLVAGVIITLIEGSPRCPPVTLPPSSIQS